MNEKKDWSDEGGKREQQRVVELVYKKELRRKGRRIVVQVLVGEVGKSIISLRF